VTARYDTISFLSDAGRADEYVGVIHAVIRDLAPHVRVVDITHDIAAFDIRAGSLALARSVAYLPGGVVLAVVDPAVGTARKAVAIEVADGEGVLVGPDNGLLAPAVAMAGGAGRAVVLDNDLYHLASPSLVASGRDVFAPVSAHLCNGVDLYELGTPIDPNELVPGVVPLPREEGDALLCEVLWIDRYGNCQLNIGPDDLAGWSSPLRITAGEVIRVAALAPTFDVIPGGAIGLVVDGSGMYTLATARRSAAEELLLAAGDQVTVAPVGDAQAAQAVTSPVSIRLGTTRAVGTTRADG
jgi:S-adenosyl-L-methionine hydrolase (adenosine-forming)